MLSITQPHKNKLICRISDKLTSLYQLSHQVGFRNYSVSDIYGSAHLDDASSDGIQQFHFHDHSIARNHFLFEFTIVNFQKISVVLTTPCHSIDGQDPAGLRQGLHLQHTRHDRISRKMTNKERFVEGYIFYSDNILVGEFNDLVDQEKRIPVRKRFFNLLTGINGL